MGIPVPPGLTPEQILAVERFSHAVWGKPLFDREPSHNGRHGYGCEFCLAELERIRAKKATLAPRQPWESNVVPISAFRPDREAA